MPGIFRNPGRERQDPIDQPMAFFNAGGVRIYLAIPEDKRFRSRPVIYYGVADLDDAYQTVAGRGAIGIAAPQLVHTDENAGTQLWMAFVEDPDGTPIGLAQERAV